MAQNMWRAACNPREKSQALKLPGIFVLLDEEMTVESFNTVMRLQIVNNISMTFQFMINILAQQSQWSGNKPTINMPLKGPGVILSCNLIFSGDTRPAGAHTVFSPLLKQILSSSPHLLLTEQGCIPIQQECDCSGAEEQSNLWRQAHGWLRHVT